MRAIHFLANLPEITLVTLVTAAAVFSLGFSVLRLYRRFGRKTRYALRITYARWALGGYVVLSTVLSLLLSFGTTSGIADFGQTLPGAILVAFSSSVIIAGSSSVVGLVGRDQKHLVSITTWVYQTIDAEIERLINQEIVDIAMRLARRPHAIKTLCDVGRCWVSVNGQFDKSRSKHKLLAQIEDFELAGDGVFEKLVGFLLNQCECDAQWLERKVIDEPLDCLPRS
jgi:hypothetical protein